MMGNKVVDVTNKYWKVHTFTSRTFIELILRIEAIWIPPPNAVPGSDFIIHATVVENFETIYKNLTQQVIILT